MLPTYKRPQNFMSFVGSALKTVKDFNSIRFCFCINKADQLLYNIIKTISWPDKNMYEIIEEATTQPDLSLYFNLMYKNTKFNESGTLISMLGDDMTFITKDWDKKILDTFNQKNGVAIVYCNDNYIAGEKMCVNLFVSRLIVEASKRPFMCELFQADMIDEVWFDIGKILGILYYFPDIIIQHRPKRADFTSLRLLAGKRRAHNKKGLVLDYAKVCAKNILESGYGKWNQF